MKTLRILLALAAATISSAKAQLVISEIDLVANKVEIVNTGSTSVNMTGYQWCNLWKGSPSYVALATAQIVAAESTATTLTLPAGGILTFLVPGTSAGSFITDLQGELGLYINGSFGNSTSLVDYVAWGGASTGRDNVAATKGIWVDNTSVTVTAADITAGRSIQLGASLAGNGFADYSLAAPTIGVNQVTPAPVVTTGSASAITANTATVSGTVNATGFSTTVTFQYGETLAYGSTIAASPSPPAHRPSPAAPTLRSARLLPTFSPEKPTISGSWERASTAPPQVPTKPSPPPVRQAPRRAAPAA